MKVLCMALFVAITAFSSVSAQTSTITADDLKVLEGEKWTGNLSYVDYSTNKKTQINSKITITRKADDPNVWVFAYEYPDEPKMNGSSEAALSEEGKKFNGGTIIETRRTTNRGMLLVVTTKPGSDNDRKALFRYSYMIGRNSFAIKKEVQLEGSEEWFTRNEYSWSRQAH